MKAAVHHRYGPPEVVTVQEVATPAPGDGEVLIAVRAASVSSADWRARSLIVPRGYGLPARLSFGMFGPRRPILGTECAGVIAEVGRGVTRFVPGDAVIAFPGLKFGCHAEYLVMRDLDKVVPKPARLSFEEAAALSFGGGTALFFLQTRGKLQRGEKLLILGASGSVGSAAVQLAHHFGAEVTAVCSAANAGLVRGLGADHVIDYRARDVTGEGAVHDVVFDTVGAHSMRANLRAVKGGGRLLLCAEPLGDLVRIPFVNLTSGKTVMAGTAAEDPAYLRVLADLAEAGAFRPVIDRVYPLDRIAEAHAHVGTGHKRGNVVVVMDAAS